MSLDLTSLGWNSFFSPHAASLAERGLVPGRVCAEHRGQLDLFTSTGVIRALIRGHLAFGLDAPGIGDWVGVRVPDDPSLPAMVEVVLPRATRFVRKAAGRATEPQLVAANVDSVLIATSLNSDVNPRRLERFLAATKAGGAVPVVVLTKADLCDDVAAAIAAVPAEHVVAVSALRGQGLAALSPWLAPGLTAALIGTSGVGKSTLVNALLGAEVQDTGGIRERDERGQHTTTTRSLFALPGGGCLVDTPGMREIGLWEGALDQVYDDVAELAATCRFRDCAHESEPGCAVLAAIDDGSLDPDRLRAMRKLERELASEVRRRSSKEERAASRSWAKKVRSLQQVRRRLEDREG